MGSQPSPSIRASSRSTLPATTASGDPTSSICFPGYRSSWPATSCWGPSPPRARGRTSSPGSAPGDAPSCGPHPRLRPESDCLPTPPYPGRGKRPTFLLIPDLATFPLRVYRRTLDRLILLRSAHGSHFPTLVVATLDRRRARAWGQMLADSSRARFDAPLPACLTTWDDPPGGLEELTRFPASGRPPTESLSRHIRLKPLSPRRPRSRLPRIVGDALSTPARASTADNSIGKAVMGLSATDRALLDLVGRHPFQTPERLASVLGWQVRWARERRNRLVARGLMWLLGPKEIGEVMGALGLVELTADGLALVAAQQGLRVAEAVRYNGLAGGGPASPIGSRRMLVANLSHTLGADGVFVHLIETARRASALGRDDALLEWRNAAACGRGHLRPDGYGIYRRGGRLYGFFLEYDQGTMSVRDYLAKFAAYHEYLASGRFSGTTRASQRSWSSPPAARPRSASSGRYAELPWAGCTRSRCSSPASGGSPIRATRMDCSARSGVSLVATDVGTGFKQPPRPRCLGSTRWVYEPVGLQVASFPAKRPAVWLAPASPRASRAFAAWQPGLAGDDCNSGKTSGPSPYSGKKPPSSRPVATR